MPTDTTIVKPAAPLSDEARLGPSTTLRNRPACRFSAPEMALLTQRGFVPAPSLTATEPAPARTAGGIIVRMSKVTDGSFRPPLRGNSVCRHGDPRVPDTADRFRRRTPHRAVEPPDQYRRGRPLG
jgi:hypothetical protein